MILSQLIWHKYMKVKHDEKQNSIFADTLNKQVDLVVKALADLIAAKYKVKTTINNNVFQGAVQKNSTIVTGVQQNQMNASSFG